MSSKYPTPFVVAPTSGQHKQSLIILHGRGSNGEKFGNELLQTKAAGLGLLPHIFMDAKFIFPTAAKRRARIYKRTPINQWFDNWHLDRPTEREELQFDGLRESTAFVHGILEAEVAAVGASNVVLWGLSQGSATAMIASLLWKGQPFAATIGMCGWLPLRKRMHDLLNMVPSSGAGSEVSPFETADSAVTSSMDQVTEYLQDQLQLPAHTASHISTEVPRFVGHGGKDDRVSLTLAREAHDLLKELQLVVEYKEYDDLGHWYSEQMLADIVSFIRRRANWGSIRELEQDQASRNKPTGVGI